ncbi:MAG: phosphoribosylamine--glycine ligase [Bdellovibrionota bacterium]
MNILIIGNGGREAAIAKELTHSKKVKDLHMLPVNQAFSSKIKTHDISPDDHDKILKFVKDNKIDLVVIGPEKPLVDGLSDFLRSNEVNVFGPSQKGAMLEGSKIFCKEFLDSAGVPTAKSIQVFSDDDILEKSKTFSAPWVVKADGLAGGKGVYICENEEELKLSGKDLFVDKKLGETRVFLEEYISGKELSYLIVTNGRISEPLPLAQDHKRIFDQDQGPNTGGMGAVAPLKIPDDLSKKIQVEIVDRTLKQLQKDNIDYRGVIYFGVMVKDNQPYVLEINARFGDPETQVTMPLLDGDWADVFWSISQGTVNKLKWKKLYATAIVMAAPGYPEDPEKNVFINGNIFDEKIGAYYICAGVKQNPHAQWVTNGGRVLNAVGIAETAKKSIEVAYGYAEKINWRGILKRSDIGQKVLKKNDFIF